MDDAGGVDETVGVEASAPFLCLLRFCGPFFALISSRLSFPSLSFRRLE